MLYRAYDAKLGRWLNRDPIEEQGGLNLYQYVFNHAVNRTDKLGLQASSAFESGPFQLEPEMPVLDLDPFLQQSLFPTLVPENVIPPIDDPFAPYSLFPLPPPSPSPNPPMSPPGTMKMDYVKGIYKCGKPQLTSIPDPTSPNGEQCACKYRCVLVKCLTRDRKGRLNCPRFFDDTKPTPMGPCKPSFQMVFQTMK
jgi:hypothetical protein